MRLAILADIHGNLPAFQAVLTDLQQFHPDGIIAAGDFIGGPASNEVILRLQELGAYMVRGNSEKYLVKFDSGNAPEWWFTAHQWAFMRWTFDHASKNVTKLVKSLPDRRVIALPGKDPICVVHGSPRHASENIMFGQNPIPPEIASGMVSEPVLICGHTHIPWEWRSNGSLVFNPGAVCGPLNDCIDAQYALLEWQGEAWHLTHRSVPYNLTLIEKAFMESGLLQAGGVFSRAVLASIQSGRDVTMAFLNHAYQMAAEAGFSDCEFVPDEIWDAASENFNWQEAIYH